MSKDVSLAADRWRRPIREGHLEKRFAAEVLSPKACSRPNCRRKPRCQSTGDTLTGAWVRESLGSLVGLATRFGFRRVDFIETHSVREGILAGRGDSILAGSEFRPGPLGRQAALPSDSISGQVRTISRRDAPEVCRSLVPLKQRAQGKPGARCTRGLACNVHQECAHEHTGSAESIRPSLRSGLRFTSCSPR